MTTTTARTTASTTATATRSQRQFAGWYPSMMERVERAGQSRIRHDQLAVASGRVLEIGAGNGFSLDHYPATVDDLVLVEPNPAFREQLRHRLAGLALPAEVRDGDAHDLAFPDASFDVVTASLLFCSVDDPARALAEVHRVLRPGGRFLFHEHVRGGPLRGALQDLVTPLQRRLADGCRANRRFEEHLHASPLEVASISHLRMPTWLPTIVPLVVGTAVRPGRTP
ncbi:class I SAM-dependent methyltransferase [Mumia sp. DW29H23]|uniref:class I SAM-dependent methyltransferase n=1 Tax=Mumia sp. DW29H23 TaxID=3421241 RepID=UPI003D69BC12